jgi:thiol-disulfide isomerase/thioredoxin
MKHFEKFFEASRWNKRFFMVMMFSLLVTPAWAEGFNIKDLDGNTHTLSSYRNKWVLVNFWATWCSPCLEEIPDLVMLHDKRKSKNFEVIGIAVDYKSSDEIRKFADDNLMSYPVVLGDDRTVKQFGSTDVLPISYLYNPQGKLVKLHRGVITRKAIEKLIDGKS